MKNSLKRALQPTVTCQVVDRHVKFRPNAFSSIGDRFISCHLACGHFTKWRLQIKEPSHKTKRMCCKKCEALLSECLTKEIS